MKNACRKMLSLLLAVAIVFGSAYAGLCEVDFSGLFAVKAQAASSGKLGDSITWELDDEGTLTIGGTGDIRKYGDAGWYPWENYLNSVVSVVIGNGITSIGYEAFCGFTSLTSITIPDSVTSIGYRAFYNCSSLTSITIPDSVTIIENDAFYDTAYYNTGSNWENDVLYIGNHLIKARSSLRGEYTIKPGTKTIATYAFYDHYYLTEVTIPDSVTSIGGYAFYECSNLTSITIPDSVTSIGSYAFYDTAYYNTESNWENDVLYIGNHLIKARSSLSGEYTIKPGTKTIAAQAFYNCNSLTSVIIGNGVTDIGSSAFYSCDNLASVTIGSGVEKIGYEAFDECNSLADVNITDLAVWCSIDFGDLLSNPLRYAENLYINGELATEIVIPEGVTKIDDYLFYNCDSLTSVIIGNGVTDIGSSAFYSCDSLTSVIIGNGVTDIGSSAFYSCDNLASVTIGSGVEKIGYEAFEDCSSLADVNVTDLAAWCNIEFDYDYWSEWEGTYYSYSANPLYYAENLYINGELATEIVIPEGVTKIDDYLFYGCDSLTSVIIGNDVTDIGSYAFYDCDNLASVTIGSGVEKIGYDAFGACSSLADVNVTDLAAWCNIEFNYSGRNSWGEAVYSYSANPLCYAENLYINGELATNIVIPDGVTSISAYAFSADNIVSVVIPGSVTDIGSYAFSGCSKLLSVNIPDGVTNIGEGAFYGCSGLTNIEIPGTVKTVGDIAFSGCSNLVSATISEGVESIGSSAFEDCSSLVSIAVPDSVTSMGSIVFRDCRSLVTATIGNGLTYIAYYAFYGCSSLQSITIPYGVTSIDSYAFYNCSSLNSITIPDSVTSIDSEAFYGCGNLEDVYIADLEAWCSIDFDNYLSNPLYYAENLYIDGVLTKDIVIPEGVTSIGAYTFKGNAIETVTLHKDVSVIADGAFSGIANLQAINVAEDNRAYASEDGVLFNKNKTTLIKYPEAKSDAVYAIPASVVNFAENSTKLSDFKSVVLGTGYSNVKSNQFYDCRNLSNVIIPLNITSISSNAFYNCGNIDDVYYEGSQAQWGAISIASGNSYITNARFHYNVDVANWQDHYGEPDSVTPATCTNSGSQTFTCPCGFEKTETIPALGHNYSDEWIVTDEATCTADGFRYKGCSNCDDREEEVIPAYGHKGEWVINSEPTCDQAGSKSCYCENCQQDVTVEIPAKGHKFVDGFCSVCGGEYLPETNHPYENHLNQTWVINRSGALNIAITFSHETRTESCDYIYIYDGNGKQIGTYSGTSLAGKTIVVSGDTVKIRFTTDGSVTYYGFKVTKIQCLDSVFTYSVSGDGATITGYLGTESHISVPSQVGGYPVVAIAEEAFYNNAYIRSVDLPDTIERVGRRAFYGTPFYNDRTNWINGILYADNCLIDANSTALNYTIWNIKDGTTVVADYAMSELMIVGGASPETILVLPDSLKFVGYMGISCSNIGYVFYLGSQEQWSTVSVSGSGIANFPVHCGTTEHTFMWRETLSPTVSSQGLKQNICIVCGCVDATEVIPMLSGFEFVATAVDSYKLASYKGIATEVKIPSTHNNCQVTAVDAGCFKGNTTINKVVIPVGVESIGALAFMNCKNLQVVSIPATVTSIGAQAFYKFTGTIYCQRDSYAHKYAIENGIDYVIPTLEAADEHTTIDFDNMVIYSAKGNCDNIESLITAPSTVLTIGVASLKTPAGDFYGTGSTITVFDGNNYMGDYTLVVTGDTNGDSVCDTLDAWQVGIASSGKAELNGAYAMAADNNEDGVIDVADYQAVVNDVVS